MCAGGGDGAAAVADVIQHGNTSAPKNWVSGKLNGIISNH